MQSPLAYQLTASFATMHIANLLRLLLVVLGISLSTNGMKCRNDEDNDNDNNFRDIVRVCSNSREAQGGPQGGSQGQGRDDQSENKQHGVYNGYSGQRHDSQGRHNEHNNRNSHATSARRNSNDNRGSNDDNNRNNNNDNNRNNNNDNNQNNNNDNNQNNNNNENYGNSNNDNNRNNNNNNENRNSNHGNENNNNADNENNSNYGNGNNYRTNGGRQRSQFGDRQERNYDNTNNHNGSTDDGSVPLEQLHPCTVHCIFRHMHMLDDEELPDKYAVTAVMSRGIHKQQVRRFVEQSVEDCYSRLQPAYWREKCDFAKSLALCFQEKGRRTCEDWDESNPQTSNNNGNNNYHYIKQY